jgi:inosine-uridine nucleoside N-ribohydrolase
MKTKGSLSALLACVVGVTILGLAEYAALAADPAPEKIPVILDTDIGTDIDDTWALALLLKSPELDVKLVVGDHGKNLYRARLLAKFLQTAGRSDVPVGIGADVNVQGDGAQAEWVKDYNLNAYPGRVHADGVRAMIDVIMRSKYPVTLIAIGPVPNLAAALKIEPRIAEKARFVGMDGSVRLGYGGNPKICAEYNVRADAKSCQQAFTAAWPMTITPLDTCGLVELKGDNYRNVVNSSDIIAKTVIENYRIWSQANTNWRRLFETKSTTLFDTVAVYLAIEQKLVTMEELGIRVTDDGFTRIDPAAKKVQVAVSWKDQTAFEEFLARRLTTK